MNKVFLYTYNVGNNRPPSDYSSFRLFKEAQQKKADIYVVALQVCFFSVNFHISISSLGNSSYGDNKDGD